MLFNFHSHIYQVTVAKIYNYCRIGLYLLLKVVEVIKAIKAIKAINIIRVIYSFYYPKII
jgi:hypothetical protein